MQRDLGETAECMKVPFFNFHMGMSKNMIVSKVREPHPCADRGAEN